MNKTDEINLSSVRPVWNSFMQPVWTYSTVRAVTKRIMFLSVPPPFLPPSSPLSSSLKSCKRSITYGFVGFRKMQQNWMTLTSARFLLQVILSSKHSPPQLELLKDLWQTKFPQKPNLKPVLQKGCNEQLFSSSFILINQLIAFSTQSIEPE